MVTLLGIALSLVGWLTGKVWWRACQRNGALVLRISAAVGAAVCGVQVLAISFGARSAGAAVIVEVAMVVGVALLTGVLLIVGGPVVARIKVRRRYLRSLKQLEPLWVALMSAMPEHGPSRWEDGLSAKARLIRRVAEIQIMLQLLRPFHDPAVVTSSRAAAHRRRTVTDEATVIAAALKTYQDSGELGQQLTALPEYMGFEFDLNPELFELEVDWLCGIARAF